MWIPVEVDISKHVVEGKLEVAEAAHPETAVEQYMGRMASFPHFDTSRPLWDAHLLHIQRPKSASSCVFRLELGALLPHPMCSCVHEFLSCIPRGEKRE